MLTGPISRLHSYKIIKDIRKRTRLVYKLKDIMFYLLKCLCLRKLDLWKLDKSHRRHYLYNKGLERIY